MHSPVWRKFEATIKSWRHINISYVVRSALYEPEHYAAGVEAVEVEEEQEEEERYAAYYDWDNDDDDGSDPLYWLNKLEGHLARIDDISKPPPIRGEWETTSFSEGEEYDYSNFSYWSFHVDLPIGTGDIDEKVALLLLLVMFSRACDVVSVLFCFTQEKYLRL